MRVTLRTLFSVALVALLIAPLPARGAPGCEKVYAETYDLRFEPAERRYQRGDVVELTAWVTRAETGWPVSGAEIAAGLHQPRTKAYSVAQTRTNAFGKATLQLRIGRRFEPGRVELLGRAWVEQVHVVCVDVVEYGFEYAKRALRITD